MFNILSKNSYFQVCRNSIRIPSILCLKLFSFSCYKFIVRVINRLPYSSFYFIKLHNFLNFLPKIVNFINISLIFTLSKVDPSWIFIHDMIWYFDIEAYVFEVWIFSFYNSTNIEEYRLNHKRVKILIVSRHEFSKDSTFTIDRMWCKSFDHISIRTIFRGLFSPNK